MAGKSSTADALLEDLGEVVVALVQFVAWLLSAVLTNYVASGLGVAVAFAWIRGGTRAGIVTLVVASLGLLALRLRAPDFFQRVVTNHAVASLWGGWVRWRWAHVATRHDLVARSNGKAGLHEEVAKIGRINASPGVLRLRTNA